MIQLIRNKNKSIKMCPTLWKFFYCGSKTPESMYFDCNLRFRLKDLWSKLEPTWCVQNAVVSSSIIAQDQHGHSLQAHIIGRIIWYISHCSFVTLVYCFITLCGHTMGLDSYLQDTTKSLYLFFQVFIDLVSTSIYQKDQCFIIDLKIS